MWRNGNPSALLVGMQTGEVTVENGMEFPQKTKMELPFDHFFTGLFVFLEWSHVSSLYILEIRPLSKVSLANIFSHTVGSLFIC